MSYEAILYDVEDRIATITLNRPERMNSFSDALLHEWEDAIRRAAEDEGVRAVILTGAGRAFCAGADLRVSAEEDTVLMTGRVRLRNDAPSKPRISTMNAIPVSPSTSALSVRASSID